MKKILSLLSVLLLAVAGIYGQQPAPGILNYQGVARNSVGNVLVNKNITLRLTIRDGSAAGPAVYAETRPVTTNPFGLFNVQLGSPGATSVTGSIPAVPWGVGLKFIQVEIDPNGGSSFINIGTAQLASVPYSLYASAANDLVLPFIKTQANNGVLFSITNSGNNTGSRAIEGATNSTQSNAYAIVGTVTNAAPGSFSTGVRGINNGTGGLGIGVWGSQAGSGYGVYATTSGGWALRAETNSGVGVYGQSGTGTGVQGVSNTGSAGVFNNTNSGNAAVTLTASSNGTGDVFSATTTGTGSRAGLFQNNNAANTQHVLAINNAGGAGNAVNATTAGTGSAGLFNINNAASAATALQATTVGTGGAGSFTINNAAATADALTATTNGGASSWALRATSNGAQGAGIFTYNNTGGSANAVRIMNNGSGIGMFASTSGTGNAGRFDNTNAANAATALMVNTNGLGSAGSFSNTNAANTASTVLVNSNSTNGFGIQVDHSGSGGQIVAVGGRIMSTPANASAAVMGVDFSSGGASPIDPRIFGVLGRTGSNTNGVGVGAYALNGATALLTSGGGATGYSLHSTGRVRLAGINEGLNRVLTSIDALGNAQWQPLAAVGIVGGSGTLNFIPKWTPNGTTLGNSLMFDDGTRMGIATTTPAYKLDIDATTGGGNGIRVRNTASFATVDIIGDGNDQAIRFGKAGSLYSGINTLPDGDHINFFKFGAGQNLMSLNVNTGNLGVGGNPSAINAVGKVEVRGFNAANNNYSAVGGYQGVTGIVSRDETSTGMPIKIGSYSHADGATNFNFGYNAETGTSAVYNYGAYLRVNSAPAPGNFAVGLYASDLAGAANTYSAWFNGKLRYQDGTQGAGKLLVSDAIGDASWATASGAGLVSGSGTLNFIPKWTPDGNTLGNSQMFDDGQTTNIGGGASGNRPSTLTLWQSPGTTQASLLFRSPAGQLNGIHSENDGKLYFTANTSDPSTADKIMTLDDDNLSVGIGTTTPDARLHVTQSDAWGIRSDVGFTGPQNVFSYRASNLLHSTNANHGLLAFNNHSSSLIPGWHAGLTGVDSTDQPSSSGVAGFFKGNNGGSAVHGVSSQNQDYSVSSVTSLLGFVGGSLIGGDAGVHAVGGIFTGNSPNKYGVYASALGGTTAIGIRATAGGATNNWAGYFDGRVAIVDGTQGDGYVFTSDASGNGSWQGPASLKVEGIGVPLVIPSFTQTPITQWASVSHELGSVGNYNPITGEYTVPANGVYHVSAHILWDQPTVAGNGWVAIDIFINGSLINAGYNGINTAQEYTGCQVSADLNLNAGDRVSIVVYQATGANLGISPFGGIENHFSVHKVK